MNMKVQSIKSYINFASVEKESQKTSDIQSADAKKEKREKIIKYSIAAAAAAAAAGSASAKTRSPPGRGRRRWY